MFVTSLCAHTVYVGAFLWLSRASSGFDGSPIGAKVSFAVAIPMFSRHPPLVTDGETLTELRHTPGG